MRTISRIIPAAIIFLSIWSQGLAQSSFSPEAYKQFRTQHVNYTAGQLLSDYPARTTYYSQRQYPVSLVKIPWFDTLDSHFQFTADEKEILSKNCFMVSERLRDFSWTDAFIDLYGNDLPLFISSDFVLSTLHNSYDAVLQTIEWQYLEPNLKELLLAMYNRFPMVAASYADDSRFEPVLEDVDLYISVALSLAEGKNYFPQWDTHEKFNQVMGAVAAEQMTWMTLFTESRDRKLDFSQFTPRGHYNKIIYTPDGERTLENYFRAMMWLGRIDFLLTAPPENPWEADWTEDELQRMQLGALLTNEVLYSCGKLTNLNRHEEIISFIVGPDDNLTPAELYDLSEGSLDKAADLFEKTEFDNFMKALNASDDYGQKIMSNFFFVNPDTSDPGMLPVSYKLLGQKFLIDSYVFSEVVFDRIVFEGEKIWRPLPDPLDAMAALGNEDALALLEGELERYKYASNMASLKYLIEEYDDDFWEQSLYNTWLGALRSLNPPASTTGMPYFMLSTAWHQQKLNTQLTSWAQLRHDNILYGKQSYTGGTGCSYPYTYVEPYPGLYRKLMVFAEKAEAKFEEVLPAEIACKGQITSYYRKYALLMEKLHEIAKMELSGTKLTESQVIFLKTMINDYMASGPSVTGWYTDLFFDVQKGLSRDFTVADVHTQPTEYGGAVVGNVLHVGNGVINMGVFLAENPCNPKELMAFAGPLSSFHTNVTGNFKRLTDQEWEDAFLSGYENFPDRPDWVATYLLNKDGELYDEGRELQGALYTGLAEQLEEPQLVDYLLLFPNPVEYEAHVRFVLKRDARFSMIVYDMTGRVMHKEDTRMLYPAEHDMLVPADSWASGLYLVRINLGDLFFTRELVVQ
jgi:hypothetical protein